MQNNFFDTLKAAFEHSPVPFAILDNELEAVYSNPALLKSYGDLSDPAKLYMLFESADMQAVTNYLKSEKAYELICDLPEKKGVHIYLSALFSGDGEFMGATATLPDLLDSREDILSNIDQNDYQMAINHELRDRISTMFSLIQVLSDIEDIDKSPKVCDFFNNMNKNCYELLRVSDNLARITRLSIKNDHISLELTDLSEYMRKLVLAIVRLANKDNIPIYLDCPTQIIPVRLDSSRMEFALANIILNSLKYTRDGNEINISVKVVGKNAIISISDSGAGIPKDILSLVGTPYFSYSHNGKFEAGFGISLYTAKKYIASHGGNFALHSVEGEGTTVTISIPLDTDDGTSSNFDTLRSPTPFEPESKYSQTRIQLSEVCYHPIF